VKHETANASEINPPSDSMKSIMKGYLHHLIANPRINKVLKKARRKKDGSPYS
jgi:hypothetical protein